MISHYPKLITDGLVLCLDAGNKTSYSGTGNTWFDLSGKKYHATLYNSPAFSNGYMQFRSATTNSKYAVSTFPESVLRDTISQWTIEVVFKYISTPSSDEAVVAGRLGCHGGIYLYQTPAIYHAIKTNQCWTGAVNTSVNSITANKIYHSTMTYNNGTVKHYLNGLKAVNDSILDINTYSFYGYSTSFYIGGIPSGNPELYATNIDLAIVRCYTRELSSSEVLDNFTMSKGRFSL
jgi:hypothetical protein